MLFSDGAHVAPDLETHYTDSAPYSSGLLNHTFLNP